MSNLYLIKNPAAFRYGDPMRVINPTDSKGLTCGTDEQVKDKPYLFFFDMLECTNLNSHGQCQTPQVSKF